MSNLVEAYGTALAELSDAMRGKRQGAVTEEEMAEKQRAYEAAGTALGDADWEDVDATYPVRLHPFCHADHCCGDTHV